MISKNKFSGFTLVEIMVTVLIVAILAGLAIVNIQRMYVRSRAVLISVNLRSFENAFNSYFIDNSAWPVDNHITYVSGMEPYINPSDWASYAMGGSFNWEGPSFYTYAGISLTDSTAPAWHLEEIDRVLDDGDLTKGNFYKAPNDRYTYIIFKESGYVEP